MVKNKRYPPLSNPDAVNILISYNRIVEEVVARQEIIEHNRIEKIKRKYISK